VPQKRQTDLTHLSGSAASAAIAFSKMGIVPFSAMMADDAAAHLSISRRVSFIESPVYLFGLAG
jgi:hypothetical protein